MFNIALIPFYMARALLLTIVFETGLALILGVRKKRDIAVVVLAQAVTNPVLVITAVLINFRFDITVYYIALAALEISAVAAEGFIYKSVLDYKKINPFLLSLVLNAFSFTAGQILNSFVF